MSKVDFAYRVGYIRLGTRSLVEETFGIQPLQLDGRHPAHDMIEARRHRRFKLEVEIRVYARDCPVVRGHTVDISESGISAILAIEVPVGEVVRLEFALPFGGVDVLATTRQRSAFRYGFQFVEESSAQDVIGRTCHQFGLEQALPTVNQF